MTGEPRVALYASVGSTLLHYDIDPESATLVRKSEIELPVDVQYAWPHPREPILYAACSNGAPGKSGDTHCAVALQFDRATGELRRHGEAVDLPSRPIHIATDVPGAHALVAYNKPSGITVHAIEHDGRLGPEIEQREKLDVGVFAHQVRVAPSNRMAILVTRGNDPEPDRGEDPGALKLFEYADGKLKNKASIAPDGGYGFGPRHLDFHPTEPWLYVALERQNRLHVFRIADETVESEPAFVADTLADPYDVRPAQRAGTVHVHPNGRFVYVANRASGRTSAQGTVLFAGGENNIVVYAVDETSGALSALQHENTRGLVPRTFAIDPSGRLLVVANSIGMACGRGLDVAHVSANLALFRIGDDGRLTFSSKHDVDTGEATLFWMGLVPLGS